MKTKVLILACSVIFSACAGRTATNGFPAGEWIDLTHEFSDETVYWVNAEPFKREGSAAMTDKGFFYASGSYSAAEHGGTHIDAPIHFAEGKKTVDQLALSELIGPAVKIDVSGKAAANRDYLITIDDILAWENANGEIPAGSIVLFQTGFAKFWPDKRRYLGTDGRGDTAVADLRFPGLHPDAADWLIRDRSPKAVGIDTASIDYGQSTKFESHVALMTHNIPAFENVADMSGLPSKGFYILAMPMKIKNGSGGPLRIVAFVLK